METLTLQAETGRLFDLVIHSLYTEPEVFLRELVANASDALDRRRIEAYANPDLLPADTMLGIDVIVDPSARTLTVRDNGIGMNRSEVVSHLGTIARSGTQDFQRCAATSDSAALAGLIGRFGVGFYSCFMVASRVTLVTRRPGDVAGTRWESAGTIEYTVDDAGDVPVGTAVTLHLEPVDHERGVADYTDRWVLASIVRRYVDFVTYPITYIGPDEERTGVTMPKERQTTVVLNSMRPIWTRPAAGVTDDEYDEFYQHLSHDWNGPELRMSFKAEGRWEYSALLFVPTTVPSDLFYHAATYGLQLYSHRMLVTEHCRELVPRYLRFLKGVVDAADLPLNVSRQHLQGDHHVRSIRKWLAKKVLRTLSSLRDSDSERYLRIWRAFGRAIKEGVSEDSDNRADLVPLLLFPSSADASQLTSLASYVSRMQPGQRDIFYISAESRIVAERSPHLETLRARNLEVLYFVEPVDELLARALSEYEGHALRSVTQGELQLDAEPDSRRETEAHEAELAGLLRWLRDRLSAHIKDVRISTRLTSSPACLAGHAFDHSPHIARLLKDSLPPQRRTLELNPQHPIVMGLQERLRQRPDDPLLATSAELLLGVALLAEGSPLPDPPAFTTQLNELLARTLVPSEDHLGA